MDRTCNVLLADTDRAVHIVERLLGKEFSVATATSWDDAVRLVVNVKPKVVVVGYHFDEMRANRLVEFVRELGEPIGVVVVRGLPAGVSEFNEEAVAETYRQIGAHAYLPLHKTSAAGDGEAEMLRSKVRELCNSLGAARALFRVGRTG